MNRAGWAAAALFPAFLGAMYLRHGVAVPLFDQWEWPLFLERWHTGTLRWDDFWAQHNEHRPVFPRMLLLALAAPSAWDIRLELALNFALGLAITAMVLAATARASHGTAAWWWPPLAAMLCCSLIQWQNWFLGWQSQLLLAALAVYGAIAAGLSSRPLWSPVGVVACATVASLSFASGLLAWPLGLAAMLIAPRRQDAAGAPWTRADAVALFSVSAAGIAVAAAYFHGYVPPPHHPGLASGLGRPVAAAAYALVYLGQPVAGWSVWAAGAAGAAGVAWWLWSTPGVVRGAAGSPSRLAWLWGVWALAGAVSTALPRAAFGIEQALSPRYATFAIPLWIGAALWTAATPSSRGRAMAAGMLAVLAGATSLYGAYRWTERHAVYQIAREALRAGGPVEDLRWLHPDVSVVLERRALLETRGWSVFRD